VTVGNEGAAALEDGGALADAVSAAAGLLRIARF